MGVMITVSQGANSLQDTEVLPLIKQFGDKHWISRAEAAISLGHIGDIVAVPALRVSLQDAHSLVRYYVVEALKQIGTPEAIKAAQASQNHGCPKFPSK